jgi:hypothetical protein
MASGTISGADRGSEGSLIELTRNGAEPHGSLTARADISGGRRRGRRVAGQAPSSSVRSAAASAA